MLELFEKARRIAREKAVAHGIEYTKHNLFRLGRAGHAAGYLCGADPSGFEPEEGHELHGDIEWYYRLWVIEDNADCPWEVEVNYVTGRWSKGDRGLECVIGRTPLTKALHIKKCPNIDQMMRWFKRSKHTEADLNEAVRVIYDAKRDQLIQKDDSQLKMRFILESERPYGGTRSQAIEVFRELLSMKKAHASNKA